MTSRCSKRHANEAAAKRDLIDTRKVIDPMNPG
jgi:hypothetical protein